MKHQQLDFPQLIQTFLDECEFLKGLRPKTVFGYRSHLRQLASYLKDLPNADKAFDEAVQRAIMTLLKHGVKAVSVASYLGAWSAFGGNLHIKGIRKTPFVKPKIKVGKRLPAFLQREEFMRLLEVPVEGIRDVRAQNSCRMLLDCGLRCAELLDLKPEDLGEEFILIHGKGDKERSIPWLEETRQKVLEHMARYPGEYVFSTIRGTRVGDSNLLHDVKRLAAKAGLGKWVVSLKDGKPEMKDGEPVQKFVPKRVWLHLLRHTFATNFLGGKHKGNIRVLSEMMGHSSLEVTSRYSHLDNQIMRMEHQKASPLAR